MLIQKNLSISLDETLVSSQDSHKTLTVPILDTLFILQSPWWKLRYESSTLILYKELSSTVFQSLSVSEWVRKASVTPVQISTLFNI